MMKMLAVIGLFLASSMAVKAGETLDRVIALVDEDVVLESELNRRYDTVLQQNANNTSALPETKVLRYQILQRLIDESIQYQLAKKSGVQINEYQLNQTIQNIIDEDHKTLPAFRNELAQKGQSFEIFREDIRKELMITQIQQYYVNRRIFVSDQEVATLVNQIKQQLREQIHVHLQHLYLPLAENASETEVKAQQAITDQIRQKYTQGIPFQGLIHQYTDDQSPNAGDLGVKSLNELPELFIEPIESANSGDLIGPLRSSSGLHLLYVKDIQGQQKHFIEQVNARHILIKPSEIFSDEHIRLKLEEVRQQILNNQTTFAAKAVELSDDAGSGSKGGELGWNSANIYVPEFTQTLKQLAINEISAPFKTQFGWHIVQLLGKRSQDVTAEQTERKAQNIIRSRKFEQELLNWQQELRDNSFVEIVSPEFIQLELEETEQ